MICAFRRITAWTPLLAALAAALLSACAAQTVIAPTAAPQESRPAVQTSPAGTPPPGAPAEIEITEIPLAAPLDRADAEFSGLGVYGDTLVLLPQYPQRLASGPARAAGGVLFALGMDEIGAWLDAGSGEPLQARPVALETYGIERSIRGFEGFEAIAFADEAAYLTIEAKSGTRMHSYLVKGEIAPDLSFLRLDAESLVEVPLDVQINNFSNEAIVIRGGEVILFYEANGAEVTEQALARRYSLDLEPLGTYNLDPLEYRLTDASAPDEEGRFWVSNYFFPGDLKIVPRSDPLAEQFGQGPTHQGASVVERLVELQLPAQGGDSISLVGRPPLQIRLAAGQVPRNWEGLARLDGRGFLMVTDLFPKTILAFVPVDGGQP